MRKNSLAFLRASLGLLMILWGLDKLVNVEHSLAVSERFYLGLGARAPILHVFGVLQTILGALVVVGLWRSVTYPILFTIALATALGVWRSILDPWGWFLDGSDVLFFPSLIILAATLVVWAFQDMDALSADYRRKG